jgi:class 3 adenylate cyclase
MVGFTKFSSTLDPSELMGFLTELYSKYAEVLERNSLYGVEVIGDALLAVAGCPERLIDKNHAARAVNAAMELIAATKLLGEEIQMDINIRVGLHTGPVIAGVVGQKDPRYHLFGETVKIAENMESSGSPGKVHVSESTYNNIQTGTESEIVQLRQNCQFVHRTDLGVQFPFKTYFVAKNLGTSSIKFRKLTLGRIEGLEIGLRRVSTRGGSGSPRVEEVVE